MEKRMSKALVSARDAVLRLKVLTNRELAKQRGAPAEVRKKIMGQFATEAGVFAIARELIDNPPALYARDLKGIFQERIKQFTEDPTSE